jgi:hypothetical protein
MKKIKLITKRGFLEENGGLRMVEGEDGYKEGTQTFIYFHVYRFAYIYPNIYMYLSI